MLHTLSFRKGAREGRRTSSPYRRLVLSEGGKLDLEVGAVVAGGGDCRFVYLTEKGLGAVAFFFCFFFSGNFLRGCRCFDLACRNTNKELLGKCR